jgi:hypothetical protein
MASHMIAPAPAEAITLQHQGGRNPPHMCRGSDRVGTSWARSCSVRRHHLMHPARGAPAIAVSRRRPALSSIADRDQVATDNKARPRMPWPMILISCRWITSPLSLVLPMFRRAPAGNATTRAVAAERSLGKIHAETVCTAPSHTAHWSR